MNERQETLKNYFRSNCLPDYFEKVKQNITIEELRKAQDNKEQYKHLLAHYERVKRRKKTEHATHMRRIDSKIQELKDLIIGIEKI